MGLAYRDLVTINRDILPPMLRPGVGFQVGTCTPAANSYANSSILVFRG